MKTQTQQQLTNEDSGNKIYNKLGKLIKAVDDLRDAGLNEVLNLPKIVVLGSQSSGKSSVLESIIGIDCLPRGDGVVTRRPLELRLVHLPYQDNIQAYAVFEEIKNEKFTNFSVVKQKINELTDKVAGNNKNIVNQPIKLSIYSNTCPDMTLIDLPGITRIKSHNSDQPENIYEITKNMAESFCKEESCIILAVIPANQDLTTSEALQMAMQLDKKGSRTIGVITKIDIMDHGTNAKKTIIGDEVKLNLGFIGVKNRSQDDINKNITVEKALIREKEFFQSHPIYSKMERSYFGTDSLVEKLKVVFMGHLKSYLPQIYNNIKDKLSECTKNLNQLGTTLDALYESNKMSYINNLVNQFCESVEKVLSGKKVYNEYPFNSMIRKNYIEFLENFKNDYSPSKSINNDELIRLLKVSEGTDMSGFPSSRIIFTILEKDFGEVRKDIDNFYLSITNIIYDLISQEIDSVFKRFPKLVDFMNDTCNKFIEINANKSKELSNNIAEMNFSYLYVDENLFKFETIIEEIHKSNVKSNDDYFQSLGEYSKKVLDQYFSIIIRNLREFIPKTWGHFFVRSIKEKLRGEILSEVTKQDLIQLLEENPEIAEKVKYYQNLYRILKNSEKILTSDQEIKQFIKEYNLKPKIEVNLPETIVENQNDKIIEEKVSTHKNIFGPAIEQKNPKHVEPSIQINNGSNKNTLFVNNNINDQSKKTMPDKVIDRSVSQFVGKSSEPEKVTIKKIDNKDKLKSNLFGAISHSPLG